MTVPAPVISAELKALLRGVKLGRSLDTLPERLALARANKLSHAEFLELVLADEVTRRDTHSASSTGTPPPRSPTTTPPSTRSSRCASSTPATTS
jgi:hypothetical protein